MLSASGFQLVKEIFSLHLSITSISVNICSLGLFVDPFEDMYHNGSDLIWAHRGYYVDRRIQQIS